MNSVHDAVVPALAFLRDYYVQVDRMMSDLSHRLQEADPPWQRLRRMGNSYETDSRVMMGEPERFLPQYLGCWFAPSSAFPGRNRYGADPLAIHRLAYAGVWMGTQDVAPELYAGWTEGMTWVPGKVVETQLEPLNGWLDPDETTPPQELTGLDSLVFDARPFRNHDDGRRMAMARVSLSEIDGPVALRRFVDAWLAALHAGVVG